MEVEKKDTAELIANTHEESKQLLETFQHKNEEIEKKEEEDKQIRFTHKLHDKYGFLSNLYECKFTMADNDGLQFKSVEHYYQAMKFEGTKKFEVIRRAGKPIDAHKLAQKKDATKNKDWKEIKVVIMRKGMQAKFDQNAELKKLLLETYPKSLIDVTPSDTFWAQDPKKGGENLNGKILMGIREEYRKDTSAME